MKHRPAHSAALLMTCALSLAASGGSASAQDKADAKTQVLVTLDNDWSKAAEARNVEQVASFYADDAIAYPPGAPAAVGHKAAHDLWAQGFADPSYQVSWKTNGAAVDRTMGWTTGTYQESYKGPDGKTVTSVGKYVCVWRKGADGTWKAIRDIWNPDK